MTSTVKDKAIILRRKPFGEADLMLTLYGEKSGKVRVLAKGARRITSKLLGFTELFTLVSCQINFKSSIPVVSQMSHEQIFDGIAENRTLYERLHIVSELLDKGCQEEEANPALFRTFYEGMNRLVVSDHPLILSSIILHLARILGFEPQIYTCAHCGNPVTEEDRLIWSEVHGGVVSCAAAAVTGAPLTLDDIKVMRYLAKSSFEEAEKLRIETPIAANIERLLLRHVQYVLEQDFITLRKTANYVHVD